MPDLCREIESFLERIEELLEMCKYVHMDKNSFISCGRKLPVGLCDMGLRKIKYINPSISDLCYIEKCRIGCPQKNASLNKKKNARSSFR